jgi:hypothetical protein
VLGRRRRRQRGQKRRKRHDGSGPWWAGSARRAGGLRDQEDGAKGGLLMTAVTVWLLVMRAGTRNWLSCLAILYSQSLLSLCCCLINVVFPTPILPGSSILIPRHSLSLSYGLPPTHPSLHPCHPAICCTMHPAHDLVSSEPMTSRRWGMGCDSVLWPSRSLSAVFGLHRNRYPLSSPAFAIRASPNANVLAHLIASVYLRPAHQ